MVYTSWELFLFLKQITLYEEGLYSTIKKQIIWTPRNKKDLLDAVNMYKNKSTKQLAIKKYYLISLWDTSNIKDMSYLFAYYHIKQPTPFNENMLVYSLDNLKKSYLKKA